MYLLKDKVIMILVGMLLIHLKVFGQFDQFQLTDYDIASNAVINPAFSGNDEALSITLSGKKKWIGFDGAPESQVLAIHTPLNSERIGLGLQLHRVGYGIQQDLSFIGSYAYRIKFKRGTLSLGISFNLSQSEHGWQDVVASDPDDESISFNSESIFSIRFGIGISYRSGNFLTGLSFMNLFSNNMNINLDSDNSSNYTIPNQVFYSLVYDIRKIDNIKISPSILLRYNSATGLGANFNTLADFYKTLGVGVSVNTEGTVTSMLRYWINNQATVAWLYSFETNPALNQLGGSHEIVLKYVFNYELIAKNPR